MLKKIVFIFCFLLSSIHGEARTKNKVTTIAIFPWLKQSIQTEAYSALGFYNRKYLVSLLKQNKTNYLFSKQALILWQGHHKHQEAFFPADIVFMAQYQKVGHWLYIQIKLVYPHSKTKELVRVFTVKESDLPVLWREKIIPFLQSQRVLTKNKPKNVFAWNGKIDRQNLFLLTQAAYTNQTISLAVLQDLEKKINPRITPVSIIEPWIEAKILYAAKRKSQSERRKLLQQSAVFLQQAILYHRQSAALHRLLAETYAFLGTYSNWIYKTASEALAIDPNDIVALFLQAFAIGWENQASMIHIDKLIHIYPWLWQEVSNPTFLFQQGNFNLELAKSHVAWKQYKQKQQLDKNKKDE